MTAPIPRPEPESYSLPRVTVTPVMPESEQFYRTATDEQWAARMAEKYGADWETRYSTPPFHDEPAGQGETK